MSGHHFKNSVENFTTPLRESSCQWLPPLAYCCVCKGWTQDDSYLIWRGSRTERGGRAYSPAWSELSKRKRGVVI
ncbi:hypothetical protein XO88_004624 [Salmonella enterica subsp. enterica serovar Anatum]|nr:hypothetical protein [Salmonella enterica subsp. enterica serovar Anatum]HBW8876425.1 hypothetical protein [Klebsiella quasipneumoniae subsp. similipneumoniae]